MPDFEIDYTAINYDQMLSFLDISAQKLIPEWTNRSDTDLNWATLKLMASLLEINNFYCNFAVNESVPSTVRTIQGFRRLARSRGFFPSLASGGLIEVEVIREDTSGVEQISVGQEAVTRVGLLYSALSEVTFGIGESTKTVDFIYGTYTTDVLATADGAMYQEYGIPEVNMVQGQIEISVDEGSGDVTWDYVESLSVATASDEVYTLNIQDDGTITVLFGDDVNGKKPPLNATIKYSVVTVPESAVDDLYGNTGIDTLASITGLVTTSLLHPAGAGGSRAPTLAEHVRDLASFEASSGRAVTTGDHEFLARRINGVHFARAVGAGINLTALYIADVEGNPLPLATRQEVELYIQQRAIDGKNVDVLQPSDVFVDISIVFDLLPNTSKDEVLSIATTLIDAYFGRVTEEFIEKIYLSRIYDYLQSNMEHAVLGFEIIVLDTASGTEVKPSIVFNVNEIGKKGTVTLATNGGI